MIAAFLFIYSLLLSPVHNMPVAMYELEVLETHIQMEAKFDKENLEAAILMEYAQEFSPELIESYLTTHSSWKIDEEELAMNVMAITSDHEFYFLEAEFPFESEALSTFHFQNTCLIKEVEGHSNIIFLSYQGKERAFRLTANRTETIVDW